MEFPGFSLDVSRLGQTDRPLPDTTYDLLVIGGGPAALSAAVYAARKMMQLAVVTEKFGGQMADTSEIENYIGFRSIGGSDLVSRFVEHVKAFDVPIAEGENVSTVSKVGDLFEVRLETEATYRSTAVVVATGKHHRRLEVPGEEPLIGRGVAYCSICDAPFYRDKRVVVVGGGNSAFTAALDLLKLTSSVTMVNFVSGWQADAIMVEAVKRHAGVELLDHHAITRIEGRDRVEAVHVQERSGSTDRVIPADGVFIEIGLIPNTSIVRDLVELGPGGHIPVDCHCATSVAGLFAAGDVTTVPYNQIVISAGEGAKAALSAYDYVVRRQMA